MMAGGNRELARQLESVYVGNVGPPRDELEADENARLSRRIANRMKDDNITLYPHPSRKRARPGEEDLPAPSQQRGLAALERVFQRREQITKEQRDRQRDPAPSDRQRDPAPSDRQRDPAPSDRQRDPAPSDRQRDPAPSTKPGHFNEREYYESLPRRPMFVYGTLRTGQGNWRNFLQGRTSQETPAVARDRALYDNGLAYAHERPGHQVVGDLVEVSEADYAEVMQSVDGLEGYNPRRDNGHYVRRTCTVQTNDGREVEAWIYHGSESSTQRFTDDDLVPDGDWLAGRAKALRRRVQSVQEQLPPSPYGKSDPEHSRHLEQTETRPNSPYTISHSPAARSKPVHYFAFGSNMDEKRMKSRGVRYTDRQAATLPGYRLTFDKNAGHLQEAGYATVQPDPDDQVEGALYTTTNEGIRKLDAFEGYPIHYDRKTITVLTADGKPVQALAYLAQPSQIRSGLHPTKRYLGHLLAGRDILSPEYTRRLEQTETIPDPPPPPPPPPYIPYRRSFSFRKTGKQSNQQSASRSSIDPREARRQDIDWQRQALQNRTMTHEEQQEEMEQELEWEQLALEAMEADNQQRESTITETWEQLQRDIQTERTDDE
jgi:gamma-glutamylcyclotransferase (GGCT)/AIG2-like uncharacterized protein YtfP